MESVRPSTNRSGEFRVNGRNRSRRIMLYTLSSCEPCKKARDFLTAYDFEYEYVDVDRASPEERRGAIELFEEDLPANGRNIAFPLILIDGEVLIGFNREQMEKALGLK